MPNHLEDAILWKVLQNEYEYENPKIADCIHMQPAANATKVRWTK